MNWIHFRWQGIKMPGRSVKELKSKEASPLKRFFSFRPVSTEITVSSLVTDSQCGVPLARTHHWPNLPPLHGPSSRVSGFFTTPWRGRTHFPESGRSLASISAASASTINLDQQNEQITFIYSSSFFCRSNFRRRNLKEGIWVFVFEIEAVLYEEFFFLFRFTRWKGLI